MKFLKSVTAERMREIDRLAQEKFGIPSIIMMENAGRSVADVTLEAIKLLKTRRVYIFCGRGNNGGDGLVAARYLINASIRPRVFLLGEDSGLKDDPQLNFKILTRMGCRPRNILAGRDIRAIKKRFDCGLMVDAIFGTGFNGLVEGPAAGLIDLINRRKGVVVSVDVPSGLNATTGVVENLCVKATKTVTFGLPKKGFFVNDGPRHVGEIIVKDIGLPRPLLK